MYLLVQCIYTTLVVGSSTILTIDWETKGLTMARIDDWQVSEKSSFSDHDVAILIRDNFLIRCVSNEIVLWVLSKDGAQKSLCKSVQIG